MLSAMNRIVKLPIASISCVLLMASCSTARHTQVANTMILQNTSSILLTDKPVTIQRSALKSRIKEGLFPLILTSKGDTIASQLDDLDGDKQWDELFFVVNLPANETENFILKWEVQQPQYVKRTSVRFGKRMSETEKVHPATNETVYAFDMPKRMGFQRYQTDGPTWENDKVGFRHYLDGRNAKDVFGKKASFISPEDVGINAAGAVEDNYHVMASWGRDVMAVQNSIGIGGIAMLKDNNIYRLGVTVDDTVNNVERTDFHIITEGPVRSMFNISYHNWKPAGKMYDVSETPSITPGMYAYKNTVKINRVEGTENLLLGIVSIFSTHPPEVDNVNDKWIALLSHDKHSYNKEWWLPLALIVPADAYLGFIDAPKNGKLSNSYLVKLKTSNNKAVSYYAVACWEGADKGFTDPTYFRNYVENLTKQISADVKVSIH